MPRTTQLRIFIVLGLLAGFALSPKLWMSSSRFYPLTPAWSLFPPLPDPFDHILFIAMVALLTAAGIAWRKGLFIPLLLILAFLALQDQSRWQPWFYQYFFMLLALAVASRQRPADALNTCCLIIAATYFWSGVAKCNPFFVTRTFPGLLKPFIGDWPPAYYIAFLAPLLEFAIGAALVTRRWRRPAVVCAIAMHVFILLAIGPLGQRHNAVVWPWNLAMIAFLPILFSQRSEDPSPHDILWGHSFPFQKVVLILFGLLPSLSFVNRWDHYLSMGLYSGNANTGTIFVTDSVLNRLPPEIADYVYEDKPDHNGLDICDWSLGELNVPCCPEIRIFRNVAKSICGFGNVELVVEGQLALVDSKRHSAYSCADLR